MKEQIIKSFTELDSHLKIAVATIAFGMGIDCPNIHRVIHFGPASSIEDYIQEQAETVYLQLHYYGIT